MISRFSTSNQYLSVQNENRRWLLAHAGAPLGLLVLERDAVKNSFFRIWIPLVRALGAPGYENSKVILNREFFSILGRRPSKELLNKVF